ncbi:BTB/POZ domain-containing protein [Acorus calamus]|uniref:BTB/POZ domain-containing protein n=1 Tax=Acorus calamus TaxID=4465 RepID=A0AAV9F4B4_ACOCL|nr:BTB/POZ domain-containing protein [Acorus calamus]
MENQRPVASVYRLPRNTICLSCYEGAKSIVAHLNNLESQVDIAPKESPGVSQSNSLKGLANAWVWMNKMMEMEEQMKEKLCFLEGFVSAFRDGAHTDIFLKAGNGPPIPSHKSLLASKSEIFKTMLECEDIKSGSTDTVTLPELTHAELRSLLEFLYAGSLPDQDADAHAGPLMLASDKYCVPFLRKFCERRMLGSLGPSNALDVLEVSDACSNHGLRERAMEVVVKHVEEIVFSDKYEVFALKNAHLCVDVARALVVQLKARKDGHT